MGTGESVRMSSKTRIAFLTYGFFKGISRSDPGLSKWAAVVMDEVSRGVVPVTTSYFCLGIGNLGARRTLFVCGGNRERTVSLRLQ